MVGLDILPPARAIHFGENRLEPAKLLRRDALGNPLTDQLVERFADVIDFIRFSDRYLTDKDAAILLRAHQAGLLEGPQCFPDRTAARPESRRQFAFIDALADGEMSTQDQLLDLDLHQGRQ